MFRQCSCHRHAIVSAVRASVPPSVLSALARPALTRTAVLPFRISMSSAAAMHRSADACFVGAVHSHARHRRFSSVNETGKQITIRWIISPCTEFFRVEKKKFLFLLVVVS